MKELAGKLKKYNDIKPSYVGGAVLIVYAVLLIIIACFHEPWYDEAQAWQVARGASYYEILFSLPHYESHPPLWHLILSVPAKLGLPYEASIKTINIIFCLLGIFLLEFKSCFTNWMKTFLPFTFFIFYQFGVISRPYSMMLFALLLCAMFFKDKNDKPIRLILSLMFLCLTSDYGVAIAGGITVAWLIDIIIDKKKGFLQDLFCGNLPRLIGFAALLLLAVIIALEVWPASDVSVILDTPLWYKFYMILLVAPAEAFMTNCLSGENLGATVTDIAGVILTAAISISFWLFGIFESYRRRALHHFLLPLLFFALIGAFYSTPHHYGIYVMLFIYEFWVLRDEPVILATDTKLHDLSYRPWVRIVLRSVVALACAVSCYWTLMASLNELIYPFYYSRDVARWIRENTKDEDVVMASWYPIYTADGTGDKVLSGVNYKIVADFSVPIEPYFDHDIIDNQVLPYQYLGSLSDEFKNGYFEKTKSMLPADYILTYNTEYIPGFLEALGSDEEYELIEVFYNYRIYKDKVIPFNVMMFKRK